MSKFDNIASDTDRAIIEATGGTRGDRKDYISGLEHVIDHLQSNLDCALEEQKADEENAEAAL